MTCQPLHETYRLTRGDEINGWHPAVPDRRPRLIVPVVNTLPPMGADVEAWQQSAFAGPFVRPFEQARTFAMNLGIDAHTLWHEPMRFAPPTAMRTSLRALAQRITPRLLLMRLRFECMDSDMPRVREAAQGKGGQPLDVDYVSALVNLDRTHERAVEVGLTCRGQIFSRQYNQYVGAHTCEPMLHGQAVTILGNSTPTVGRAIDQAWEEPSGKAGRQPEARVWLEDDRWIAELQVTLNNMAGGYTDELMVYPTNFFRSHPITPHGAPAGINWKASEPGYSWAPVRFLVEEFDAAGFMVVGNLGPGEMDRQIANIDATAQRARIERRIDLTARSKDAYDAWRNSFDPPSLDTQWLPRALPGCEHLQRGFALNNSRQLLTRNDGSTLVVMEDANRLAVTAAPEKLDPVGNDLSDAVTVITEETGVTHASIARDDDGNAHLLFATDAGCFVSRETKDWQPQRLNVEGKLPYDIDCIDGVMVGIFGGDDLSLSLLRLDDSSATPNALPFEGRCPVMTPATGGGVHLAFEFNATIYYVKLDSNLKPQSEPIIAAYAECLFPAIVEADGRPLIVYQYLGLQKVDPHPYMYIADRERCGGGIGYAYADDAGRFHHGHVMRYEEIVVRKLNSRQYMLDMVNRPHRGRAFATMDENWRPSISRDGDGVLRAAWVNTSRHHAFVAQWTGDHFTRPDALAGPLTQPTPHFGLEKHPPGGSQIKHILVAEQRLLLDAHCRHAIQLDRSDDVYFLDDSAVARREGVDWRINMPTHRNANPVLELPNTGRGTGRDGLSRPTVLRGEGGVWLMIAAMFHKRDTDEQHVYARSDDGLKWEFVELQQFLDLLPKHLHDVIRNTNSDEFLAPGFTFTEGFSGMEDPLEPDPAKRFKKLTVEGRSVDGFATRRVWYSPNGHEWTKGPAAINNVHMNETHVPNIYDPWDIPERRFKIYGRTTTEQGRTLGMLWSGDMIHWHGDHAIVAREDPYSRVPGQPASPAREAFVTIEGSASTTESEHYYCIPWLEAGHTMMLYANLHHDGHKTARIGFSRDGFHFSRLGDVEYIGNGAPGEVDSGTIDNPQVFYVDDEVRFYYGGSGEKHGSLPHTGQHTICVAATQRKRWSYYEVAESTGIVTTVPVAAADLRGRGLTINKTGDVTVEIINASTGKTTGSTSDTCDDGIDVPVTWTGKPLDCGDAGAVRLRFTMRGRGCRLYGFGLPFLA